LLNVFKGVALQPHTREQHTLTTQPEPIHVFAAISVMVVAAAIHQVNRHALTKQ
jgi:low temperature requirement protein LtrA